MTTSTIAAKIRADSGRDLIRAAAAKLELVDGRASYTRQELLGEMQTATSYYKKTYSNNLSGYLNRLVRDDKLREVSKDTYALASGESSSLKNALA